MTISTSRLPNDAVCIFSYEYLSETATSNWAVKHIMRECDMGCSQVDFAVSVRYIRTRKYILHRWVRRDGLISVLVTTSIPRLKALDWCGDLC